MERRILIGCGAVGLTLLLIGAAFAGGWLLGRGGLTGGKQDAVASDAAGEIITRLGVKVEVKAAAEIPDQPIDAGGLLLRREGDLLFLGTGRLSGHLVRDRDQGTSRWKLRYDGPVIRVSTTHETRYYRDDTLQHLPPGSPAGPVEQVLTPITADEIKENSTVSAWGERHGGHLVAKLVVFYPND